MHKTYSKEFKVKACEMVLKDGMKHAEAAERLGINKILLYQWTSAYETNGEKVFVGKGHQRAADAELRKRNHRLNVTRSTKHYTGKGKEQRIFDKSPDIKERMVFLESGKRSKPYQMFMDNVYAFSVTGVNKHDDAPDSLAMAIDMDEFGETKIVIAKRVI